ncbi:DUF2855 family protein [Pseudoteredinibacter isoporae]|uniref:DUF2855 family protein n=1 Tax=Pseudoteredinibacter isoporae TaxID=570281 RepID=A0A7X0JQG7_9GAMM|nr:DUF2855 family protein [Pseudoteredinibacter isoporae]MBB6520422.1 hypothetical protein [Pseudoteredinibacter isoporae]NHO85990.1 DUF2855 family protein [Pseudoteredinibacter isoporae]NIB25559.1 DUF2855 family protein [Pseudoteredinibacter isoporae]
MNTVIGKQFWVNKTQILDTQWKQREDRDLQEDEVRLRIKDFAFTANNVTYAVMGEALQYWSFFPAGEAYGLIPVWGFAEVTESNNEAVNIGELVYGYFPMADALIVKPANISEGSFIDAMPHREALPVVYNQYIRCAKDPLYKESTEALQMLLRPLFTTSFLLQDFFAEHEYFSSEQVVMSSASSKTSIGTAFAFHQQRRKNGSGPNIIGLSSAANVDFVRSLNLYDEVYSYDDLDKISRKSSFLIDFAGNAAVKSSIHKHLSDQLQYSCIVGASHWDQTMAAAEKLVGPEPQLFFAPSQAQKRMQEWGPKGFGERLAVMWQGFLQNVGDWMTVEYVDGEEAIGTSYQAMVDGSVKPEQGLIYRVNGQSA